MVNKQEVPWQYTEYVGERLSGVSNIQAGDILLKYRDGLFDGSGILIQLGQELGDWARWTISPGRWRDSATSHWNRLWGKKPITQNYEPIFLTHAALVTEVEISGKKQLRALEMQTGGLELHLLNGETHQNNGYEVYRCCKTEVVKALNSLMSNLASELLDEKKTTNYGIESLVKTFISYDKLPTCEQFEVGYKNMLEAAKQGGKINERYYCSQLVIWLYQGASCRAKVQSIWDQGNTASFWRLSDQFSPSQLAVVLKANPSIWKHIGQLPPKVR